MTSNLIALFLLLVSLTLVARSQNAPSGHQMLGDADKFADGHVAALDQQLHLSKAQKEKLRPIFLAEGQQLMAVMNNDKLSMDQKQSAISKLHLETAAKVNSVLTPQQRQQVPPPPATPSMSPATSHT